MKNRVLISLFAVAVVLTTTAFSQNKKSKTSFPGNTWELISKPEAMGFSTPALLKARQYGDSINSAAVMIVVSGKLVYQWGEVATRYNTHSIRKSFLSAFYGKYVKQGLINLDATMADLGIDDNPPLSDEEKKATVRDCLKARSGVYHPALYESAGMKKLKPAQYSEKAGTHWYYNNWDFNVLGTIFEKQTNKKIFETIDEDIAKPIGMEDYSPADGTYVSGEESIHRAYPFRVTARDLARFGLLMLNNGNWNGRQVIEKAWVEESTRYHSDATLYSSDGYGYLWWVSRDFNKFPHLPNVKLPEGTYSARGAGGHYVLIIPAYDMVIVHRVNTDIKDNSVSSPEFGKLVNLILKAGGKN
ncbi:MAG TPA: serine hydrolase [Cyclobacteriaceae bacterium]